MDKIYLVCILATALNTVSSASCPSNICRCTTYEIASRLETEAICNTGDNKGYVPIFRSFLKPISSLYLGKTELATIGNFTFKGLTAVRELYLDNNYLVRIEARAFASIDHTIELLDLQHNRLKNLNFLTTHDFSRLRELLLRDNRIEIISPDTFQLIPSLETLILDDNKLHGRLDFLKQPSLRALSELNLDHNQLAEINPQDFLYLTNLKTLLVSQNQLSDINFLSHHIFEQLQGISAANNQLGEVDPDIFSYKNLMRWIDLSGNKLTNVSFLSSCSLPRLQEIYLSSNLLTTLPTDSFQATNSLSIFVIDNNLLQTLPRCALLRFYEQMQLFDISNNPMECNCELSWLQYNHKITTERHSKCVNQELERTNSYNTIHCQQLPQCEITNQCNQKYADGSPYQSFTIGLLQEDIETSTSGGTLINNRITAIHATLLVLAFM